MSKQWSSEERMAAVKMVWERGGVTPTLRELLASSGTDIENVAVYLQMELTEAVGIIKQYTACMGELRAPALTKTADAFLARNSTLPAAPDTKETK